MTKRRRRCKGLTKAGKRCKAWPREDGFCIAHADRETQESVGFGGAQAGAGRPRLARPHERMREKIEADLDAILAPYFDAIRDAMLSANHQGEVIMSDHPDLGARIAAAERLLDRVYGKPAQALEVTGSDGGPVAAEVIHVDARERSDAARDYLRRIAGE